MMMKYLLNLPYRNDTASWVVGVVVTGAIAFASIAATVLLGLGMSLGICLWLLILGIWMVASGSFGSEE